MNPKGIIVEVLYPWNEEVDGVKWASHTSHRQAEAILFALADAGYEVTPKTP